MAIETSTRPSTHRQALFVVAGRLPFFTGNGVSVLWDGLRACFRNMGADITVVPVQLSYTDASEENRHRAYLKDIGVEVVDIADLTQGYLRTGRLELLRRVVIPRETDFFPSLPRCKRALRDLVKRRAFDVVVGCDWASLSLTHDLAVPLRVASIVDPVRPSLRLRFAGMMRLPQRRRVVELLQIFAERGVADSAERFLRDHDVVLEHAHHHAQALKGRGVSNVF
jgi:hypothetical protein